MYPHGRYHKYISGFRTEACLLNFMRSFSPHDNIHLIKIVIMHLHRIIGIGKRPHRKAFSKKRLFITMKFDINHKSTALKRLYAFLTILYYYYFNKQNTYITKQNNNTTSIIILLVIFYLTF